MDQVKELARVLTALESDHRQFMTITKSRGRTEQDRREASTRLKRSVATAEQAVSGLMETKDPELRPLVDKLTIESTMAEHILKHLELLQRG